MKVFTYGSLMFPEVWQAVTGRVQPSSAGTIRGFVRRTVSRTSYPGILETGREDDIVGGEIYHDIDPDCLAALDQFESDFYVRREVQVRDGAGGLVACHAYVVPPGRAHVLSAEEWDRETFAARYLADFVDRNFG